MPFLAPFPAKKNAGHTNSSHDLQHAPPPTGWHDSLPHKECTGVRYFITKFSGMDSLPNSYWRVVLRESSALTKNWHSVWYSDVFLLIPSNKGRLWFLLRAKKWIPNKIDLHWVRLRSCSIGSIIELTAKKMFDYVRLSNPIERLVFDWFDWILVWFCSIKYAGCYLL